MTSHTKLKLAAETVKQAYADLCERGGDELAGAWNAAELAYDDAARPDVVLALIAENDRLSQTVESLIQMERATGNRAIEYAGKCDDLKAEVAGLRTGYEAFERVNAELKAENEALRKDADKWKSVKHAGDQLLADEGGAAIWSACSRVLISIASELNSGRSVVTEEGVTIGDTEIGDWRVTVERIDAAMGKGEQS